MYAGAATLRELHQRLNAVLSIACADHEVVFVEDAGPDDAWRVIEALAREDGRVRGLRLARNAGQHNALLCGLRAAQFPICVTLDDDLQHPPEAVPELLRALSADVDVVYGTPRAGAHSPLRSLSSRALGGLVSRLFAAPQVADISGLRAFRTALRESFAEHAGRSESLDALLAAATERFAAVPVDHAPRRHGHGGYDAVRLVRRAAWVWAGFGPAFGDRLARRLAGSRTSALPLYEVVAVAGGTGVEARRTPVSPIASRGSQRTGALLHPGRSAAAGPDHAPR